MPNTSLALQWDQDGERLYHTGVSHGVLFPKTSSGYGTGVAWNGLTSVSDSPSGGEPTDLYADNRKYLSLMSAEEAGFTIEAYTYPDAFEECDGSLQAVSGVYIKQQARKQFGFSYQSRIGNDIDGDQHDYEIHLYYNCLAAPSERSNTTVNDSPEAQTLSWTCTTTPEDLSSINSNYKPAAHVRIVASQCDETKLAAFLKKLYGDTSAPTLPSIADVITDLTPAS